MARGGVRRQAAWDTVVARQMYDKGATYDQIAEKVGTSTPTIVSYAHRNWPDRRQAANAGQRALREQAQQLSQGRKQARNGHTLPPLRSLTVDDEER